MATISRYTITGTTIVFDLLDFVPDSVMRDVPAPYRLSGSTVTMNISDIPPGLTVSL